MTRSHSDDEDGLRAVFFGNVDEPYQPAQSTQDATLWLRRYHPERLEAWLQQHEPRLRTWLNKQPSPKKLLW
jgi:hypothetical protein